MVLIRVVRYLSLLVIVLGVLQVQGAVIEGPQTVIYFPGQGPVLLTCNISVGITGWSVNGSNTVTLGDIDIGGIPGHSRNGTSLVVDNAVNNTEYVCVSITGDGNIPSEPAFLYIAGPPNMVPGVTVDLDNVVVLLENDFNFTLNWGVPFENFATIHNYTIRIGCTGSGCPLTLTNDNVTTTRNVRYTTTTMTNVTIMVTASNVVGESDPVEVEITTPSTVSNLTVSCEPVDLINQCTMNWDLLSYGPNAVAAPIEYTAEISGVNITTMSMNTDGSTVTFDLPPVMSNIFAAVQATNVFGSGGFGRQVTSDIISPAVQGTTSMLLEEDTPAQSYNIEVVCDIDPSSTADYCEAIARNDESTVSASATVMDDMATVTVSGLVCEQTYSIVAGAIITNDVMMDRTLDGPRLHMETITAAACLVDVPTTTMTTAPTVTPTMTSTRTPPPPGDGDDDSNIGAIIGGVCGGIVAVIVIIVIVIVVYFFCCKDRESGSRTMSPSGDKLPVTSAGAGAGRPTSVRVQTLDRYGKPMTDESDAGNVELTDYKPVGSPEFTVSQVPSGNNQLTTKEESRTPSSYMPEGSYDTLAPADEPQGQSAPLTQNGQDQPQKGKLNYAELEQFSRKPASVKKPETQPPSQYAVIDPKSLQGTYT